MSISASAAVRTWQIVTSGFFPPQPFGLFGQEQMTELGDEEMPTQRLVRPHLEMRQAKFRLGVLETTLDGPTREGDVEKCLDTNVRRGVA